MSSRIRKIHPLTRRTQGLLAGCALAALLHAATPDPQLDELDEVLVIEKVPRPIEDYVDYPQFDSVVVSPGGTHLALGWSEESRERTLSFVDLPSMNPHGLRLRILGGVSDLRWIDESRLLVQPDWPLKGLRPLREPLGTLLVDDLEVGLLREVHPFAEPLARTNSSKVFRDSLSELRVVEQIVKQTGEGVGPLAFGPVKAVSARPGRPDQLLFQTIWTGDADKRGFGVFELNLKECGQVRVASLPLRGGEVIIGPGHQPALTAGVNEAGERVVYFLPEKARAAGTNWELRVRSRSDERGLLPLAWTGRDEMYYALDGRDLPTRAVVVWNPLDNTRQVLYRHDDADMDAASFDPAGKPWMFSGISRYPVYWYPDPAHPLAKLHRALVQRLPREHVDILNASDDLATAVVRVSSGARPTMYLVVDVKTGKSITGMHTYPKLKGRRISPVEAIEFTARDGLVIRGYLTTPLDPDGEPRRGLPLLVIAHDGPSGEFPDYRYTADSRYDFERQLFASRGYAVLQVNVRGSAGRGTAIQLAGNGEWGRAVQDDYADAVRWAIKEGLTAAGRVCFYGTGYGAYSAMMAAAREPDLFQCVIGIAGVYDLPRLVQDDGKEEVTDVTAQVPVPKGSKCFDMAREIGKDILRPRTSLRQFRKAIEALNGKQGAPREIPLLLQRAVGNDPERLRERSPVSHASTIKAKVLLIHQYDDTQAVEGQLATMQAALLAARNPAETDMIGKEGAGRYDGYFVPQMRADAYKKLLGFLGKQIGN